MQADYTLVMPFIVKALLDKRARLAGQAQADGEENLFERSPEARGFLRPTAGYRLFEQRERLIAKLFDELKKNGSWLLESLKFPIAF
jgi:deoxyhypusine synthase